MTPYTNNSVAQYALLNHFKEVQQSNVDKNNPSKEALAAAHKKREEEERQKIFELSRINMELAMYDYVLYDFIQAYVKDAMDEAKKLGIWEQIVSKKVCKKKGIKFVPHSKNFNGDAMSLLNEAETLSNQLVTACKISERTEMLDTIVNSYNYYKNEYMNEGGAIASQLSFAFKKHAEADMINQHSVIRRAFIGKSYVDQNVVMFVVKIYKAYSFCCISDAISKYEQKRVTEKTGCRAKFKQSQSMQFDRLSTILKRLCDMYIPTDIPKSTWEELNASGQYILDHLLDEPFVKVMVKILLETIKDYTNFCIAKWVLEVRENKTLSNDITQPLVSRMGFKEEHVKNLITDLKRSRIGLGIDDVWDMKEKVLNMTSKMVKLFVSIMYDVVEEEIENPDNYSLC